MKRSTLNSIILILSVITIIGCGKDDSVNTPPVPEATVPDAPIIGTATEGDGQATVSFTAPTNNGGSTITSYTATSSPGNITGTLTQSESGTITISGLTNGTAYTFTVTATNDNGVSSASAISNSVTPTYATVLIGTQYWMVKNLDVTHYRNGDIIPQVTDRDAWGELTTGAWCYYDNNPGSGYGKLYNWYAVNDPRGLAPTGWHVPSNIEWNTLTAFLGADPGVSVGGVMKETGTRQWLAPNTGATNSSGFTGLPGGFRTASGAFLDIGESGTWLSSTERNETNVWSYGLDYDDDNVTVSNITSKFWGFSVRCIRD